MLRKMMLRWRTDPKTGPTLCASLRSRNALGYFTRGILCRNLQENCQGPKARRRLCASLHSRNALGRFTQAICAEIDMYNAADQLEHPDQAPAFALTVRTPQCGHTVWGKAVQPMCSNNNTHFNSIHCAFTIQSVCRFSGKPSGLKQPLNFWSTPFLSDHEVHSR